MPLFLFLQEFLLFGWNFCIELKQFPTENRPKRARIAAKRGGKHAAAGKFGGGPASDDEDEDVSKASMKQLTPGVVAIYGKPPSKMSAKEEKQGEDHEQHGGHDEDAELVKISCQYRDFAFQLANHAVVTEIY